MAERFLRPSSYLETYSEDGDELLLPQSIYAQLQYLETTYGYVDGEEDSYDETSDEEGALDLSAPPPESLVHDTHIYYHLNGAQLLKSLYLSFTDGTMVKYPVRLHTRDYRRSVSRELTSLETVLTNLETMPFPI